ncbi:MAG: DUF444 family protein [bacterium]|nr:DUF444 family protein [bacterium]
MDSELGKIYNKIKKSGLTPEQDKKIQSELNFQGSHDIPEDRLETGDISENGPVIRSGNIYSYHDLFFLQKISEPQSNYTLNMSSIDKLLERDKQRERDGFQRKVRVGRMIKPGKGGKDKVVVVPTTVEEKFMHDNSFKTDDSGESSGGSGEGDEGEIIGEQPVRPEKGEDGSGAGEGEGGQHEMESSAYDLGKILTEKFELPNLKDKGKKRSLTRYTYDITDKNRGFGQILDKKATLKKIVQTNISLGNIPDINDIDPSNFIVAPTDKIYRILSKEKDYESQAMVFFLRDYSGSMMGKPTEMVVTQHVLIYSWLLYQYQRQVESRFILHDTQAKEVEDFYEYYNSNVAGGTRVASAYNLVNEIVEKENLMNDYNIYVFHGTDGDDWDTDGKEVITEMERMFNYVNRIGITVARRGTAWGGESEMVKYMKASGLLEKKPDLIKMDIINDDAEESRLIEGIKELIAQ